MTGDPFLQPYPVEEGIVHTSPSLEGLGLAQRSNLWPPTAALYEPLWRHRSLGILTLGTYDTASELTTIGAWLGLEPGERLLDVGCSAGLYARTFKSHTPAAEVHAIDISLPFLRRAATNAERAGVDLTLVHGDATALPYRDDCFDAVVAGGTFNELHDPYAALAEIGRVLRPGGRFAQMYLIRSQRPPGRALQALFGPGGVHFPNAEEVATEAARVGLDVRHHEVHPPVALTLFACR